MEMPRSMNAPWMVPVIGTGASLTLARWRKKVDALFAEVATQYSGPKLVVVLMAWTLSARA